MLAGKASYLRVFVTRTDALAIVAHAQIVAVGYVVAVLSGRTVNGRLARAVLYACSLLAREEAANLGCTVAIAQTRFARWQTFDTHADRIGEITIAILGRIAARVDQAATCQQTETIRNTNANCDSQHYQHM
jgi:hypothetical protein